MVTGPGSQVGYRANPAPCTPSTAAPSSTSAPHRDSRTIASASSGPSTSQAGYGGGEMAPVESHARGAELEQAGTHLRGFRYPVRT